MILDVKPSSNQKDIKLSYYKMAKKYHPDFMHDVTEKEKLEANEMFKKVQKAYEVLGNAISRQAYDIENNLNDGSSGAPVGQDIYEDSLSRRSYYQPKQQKDFYYTKWTNYQKPDWYHPYNGHDARSEFLYLRRSAISWPRIDQAFEFLENNRLFFYLLAYLGYNAWDQYKDWRSRQLVNVELQLLEASFNLNESQNLLSLVQ
jgi:curved DNA-binding protein CbpA